MHLSAQPSIDPRYPIGRFVQPEAGFSSHPAARQQAIVVVAELPTSLADALADLNDARLDTPYREGGWTLRQLAHHVADSHLNAYARLRLALTEDWPTIKPYHEALWAELPDARTLPIEHSLALLVPLHARWTALLGSLGETDWLRGYLHPEGGPTTVETMTALYGWHGRHHTGQVLALRARMGW